jgi:hypothetical protein
MTTENIKDLKDFVQNAIDKGATSVEEVHKKIAGMPFDFVAKIGPLQESVDQVKAFQDNTIGAIYNAIRLVNAKAGDYAEEILSRHQEDPEGTSEEKA